MRLQKQEVLLAISVMAIVLLVPLMPVIGIEDDEGPTRSNGPIAQWDFNEGVGQYAYDSSGNGIVGIRGQTDEGDYSDPIWTEGLHNGALDFDGSNDLVRCGNESDLRFGKGSFSIEAWIFNNENITDNHGGIINKYDRSSDKGFFLDVINDHRYGGWGKTYGQVVLGMNNGHLNNSWNIAASRYGSSYAINDIAVYDGSLYAASSQGDLIQWKPSGWVLKVPVYLSKRVTSLAVYEGKLFGAVRGEGELLEFDGSAWNRVAQMESNQEITCLTVFNGMLYAGTSPNAYLFEWNGFGAWHKVSGQYGAENIISDLCIYNGKLYGATLPGGYLLEWNDMDSWDQKAYLGSSIYSLSVYDGELYGGSTILYEWNGASSWRSKSDPISTGYISCMSTYNGKLYVGTSFTGELLEWNGLNSLIQRAPMKAGNDEINSMCIYQGKLFASSTGDGHLLEWSSGWSLSLDGGLPSGWNQIVGVRDVLERKLLIYVNGALKATSRGFDPLLYDVNCSKSLVIGHGNQDYFDGLVDRVRIFDRPLSAYEIEEDFEFYSMEWMPPLPPSSPMVTSGDLFVKVSWGYPIFNGTNPLLGYRLYKGLSKDDMELHKEMEIATLSFHDIDVKYGTTYYYKVSAFSEAGESETEEILEATPLGLPSQPVNLTVRSGDRFVNITWEQPVILKGSNITSYRIERGLDRNLFFDLIILDGDKRYYNDTVVDNRQIYFYRVYARNEVGESPPSVNVSAVPKKLAPPVMQLEFKPCDCGADLKWENSTDPWFSNFNVYRGIRELTSGGLMGKYYSSMDLTNLSFENQDYAIDFDWGEGPPIPRMEDSQFSIKWDGYIKADVTGSYTINIRADGGVRLWIDNIPLIDQWNDTWYDRLSASVYLLSGEHQITLYYFNEEGRASIRLSWAPPEMEAHVIPTSHLFGFYLTYELIAELEENHYSDQGLELGSSYYYYVLAVNDAGKSLIGRIIEVYPIGVPDPPRSFNVITGDGYLNLTWLLPANEKGSQVFEYLIYRANGTQNVELRANASGDTFFFNDTDIVNGLTYFYYVVAVNDAGGSEPTKSLMRTPIGKPSQPRNLKVEPYETGLRVSWSTPKYTGGADMKGFNVYRSVNGGNRTFVYWVNDFMTLGYIDNEVSPGNDYNYWVTTLNEVGESEFSENASYTVPAPVVPDDDDVDPVEPDGKKGGSLVVWIVIILIVVLLIAVGLIFFFVWRKQMVQKELMLAPVPVGGVGPDETFEIFHPDQAPQGGPVVQPVGQPLVPVVQEFQPQPEGQYPKSDQSGQYYPTQQYYPDQAYPQEGGFPPQQPIDQQYYPQEGAQEQYYQQQTPQYETPVQGQYYPQQGYQPQQQYFPKEGAQEQYYQQQQAQGYRPPPQEYEQQPMQQGPLGVEDESMYAPRQGAPSPESIPPDDEEEDMFVIEEGEQEE